MLKTFFNYDVVNCSVMDLLRFPKFTLGCMWVSEYGNINEYEELSNILSYSPLHNIVGPTSSSPQYPAVFVTSADHDDRYDLTATADANMMADSFCGKNCFQSSFAYAFLI